MPNSVFGSKKIKSRDDWWGLYNPLSGNTARPQGSAISNLYRGGFNTGEAASTATTYKPPKAVTTTAPVTAATATTATPTTATEKYTLTGNYWEDIQHRDELENWQKYTLVQQARKLKSPLARPGKTGYFQFKKPTTTPGYGSATTPAGEGTSPGWFYQLVNLRI